MVESELTGNSVCAAAKDPTHTVSVQTAAPRQRELRTSMERTSPSGGLVGLLVGAPCTEEKTTFGGFGVRRPCTGHASVVHCATAYRMGAESGCRAWRRLGRSRRECGGTPTASSSTSRAGSRPAARSGWRSRASTRRRCAHSWGRCARDRTRSRAVLVVGRRRDAWSGREKGRMERARERTHGAGPSFPPSLVLHSTPLRLRPTPCAS